MIEAAEELARTFAREVSPLAWFLGSATMLGGAAAAAALAVPAIGRFVLKPPVETYLSDNLPFSTDTRRCPTA